MADGDIGSIGADGSIPALAQVDANAVSSSTSGNADAEAGDLTSAAGGLTNASSLQVVGFQADEDFTAGDTGIVNADASVDLVASAGSTSGAADADAKGSAATAFDFAGDLFSIGGSGTITADSCGHR